MAMPVYPNVVWAVPAVPEPVRLFHPLLALEAVGGMEAMGAAAVEAVAVVAHD